MGNPKNTLEKFLKDAGKIHNDYYDYSQLNNEWWNKNYKNTSTKLPIICPRHGLFYQSISNHIHMKAGCPKCRANYKRLTYKKFINQLISKKLNKYFYFLFDENWFNKNYINKSITKFPVKCKNCKTVYYKKGIDLYNGDRCNKCFGSNKESYDSLLKRLKNNINSKNYNYSLITKEWFDENYKGHRSKVPIICKKCRSIFEQQAFAHYYHNQGCPYCKSSKGEIIIRNILQELNLNYKEQYKIHIKEIDTKIYFDFYLPDFNIAIEYDGKQHFKPIDIFGGEYGLIQNQYRDKLKNKYCELNNIELIRFNYLENQEKIKGVLNERFKN